jgi:DNA-directed RNA polymerase specialized sigma subunit
LISIGTIGLIKAITTYRMDKNIKLATYASRCIENAIPASTTFRVGSSQLEALNSLHGTFWTV